MTTSKEIIFSLILFLKFCYGAYITVDPEAEADPSQLIVNTLQDAFNLLYDSASGNFYDPNNTIMLAASTAGTTQDIGNVVVNNGSGGLEILFENTPTTAVDQLSVCSTLPVIRISKEAQSSFIFYNLTYFTLQGVYLQIFYSGHFFCKTIQNITLTNSCFKNDYFTEEIHTYAAAFHEILLLTLSNSFFYQRTRAGYGTWLTQLFLVENMTIYLETRETDVMPGTAYDDHTILFGGGSTGVYRNTDVYCQEQFQITQSVFAGVFVQEVTVSNLSYHHCSIYRASNAVINFRLGVNVTITNITVSNLALDLNRLDPGFSEYFGIIEMNSNTFYSISNIYLGNSSMNGSYNASSNGFYMIRVGDVRSQSTTKGQIFVQNVTAENLAFDGKHSLIRMDSTTIAKCESYIIKDVFIKNVNLNYGALIMTAPSFSDASFTETFVTSVQNFTVSNAILYNTAIIHSLNAYLGGYLNEIYAVEMTDVTWTRIQFTGTFLADPFSIIGSQVKITNLRMTNNSISGCVFGSSSLKMSSFILSNSTVEDLYIAAGASFLGYKLDRTAQLQLDPLFFDDTLKIFEVEMRPFMILNCSFTNITLETGATFMTSKNPSVLLINNTFQDIKSAGSSLFLFGGYTPPTTKPADYSFGSTIQAIDKSSIMLNRKYRHSRLIHLKSRCLSYM